MDNSNRISGVWKKSKHSTAVGVQTAPGPSKSHELEIRTQRANYKKNRRDLWTNAHTQEGGRSLLSTVTGSGSPVSQVKAFHFTCYLIHLTGDAGDWILDALHALAQSACLSKNANSSCDGAPREVCWGLHPPSGFKSPRLIAHGPHSPLQFILGMTGCPDVWEPCPRAWTGVWNLLGLETLSLCFIVLLYTCFDYLLSSSGQVGILEYLQLCIDIRVFGTVISGSKLWKKEGFPFSQATLVWFWARLERGLYSHRHISSSRRSSWVRTAWVQTVTTCASSVSYLQEPALTFLWLLDKSVRGILPQQSRRCLILWSEGLTQERDEWKAGNCHISQGFEKGFGGLVSH